MLGWFKGKPSRSPQRLMPRVVRFIGEQDGPAERDLKDRFVELLRSEPIVKGAYLACAEHGNGSGIHITLCLKCFPHSEDVSLLPKLVGIFGSMFNSQEHLDNRLLEENEEHELRSVCAPFYESKPSI
jgi:hypothetical protein